MHGPRRPSGPARRRTAHRRDPQSIPGAGDHRSLRVQSFRRVLRLGWARRGRRGDLHYSRDQAPPDVDQAFSTARGGQIARALEPRFLSPGPEAVARAVAHASHETNVEKLAAALGHTPRGLREALHEIGMPAPARVLLWGRLLLAGARLSSDGHTVEEVAFSLGYSASTALARAMKQHTGLTPGQVAERGGMDVVRHALFPPASGAGSALRVVAGLAALSCVALSTGCATLGLGTSGVYRAAIHDVLESPGIEQMHVGVLAVDAQTGRTHDGRRKFVPASNQKILVTAEAMSMLGSDYRFRTETWATGSASSSFLDGDLVLVGSGDPSLSDRYLESGIAALEALADSLRAAGLAYVAGSTLVARVAAPRPGGSVVRQDRHDLQRQLIVRLSGEGGRPRSRPFDPGQRIGATVLLRSCCHRRYRAVNRALIGIQIRTELNRPE